MRSLPRPKSKGADCISRSKQSDGGTALAGLERHGFQPCRLQQHSPQRDAGAAYLAELALGFDGRGHPSPTWFVALRTKAGSSAAKIIRFANDLLRSE
jgi:hypothetical protein